MNGTDGQWDAALRAQEDERRREEYDAVSHDQRSVDGEMGELMARTRREEARRQLDFSNVMSSAIKQSGGGPLPEVLRGFINRRYGWDGRTTGILPGSGFQQDGSYLFRLANGADAQGRVSTQNLAFGRPQIFQMMQLNRSAFGDGDRTTMRGLLLKSGMSEREIRAMEFNPFPGAGARDPDLLRNRMGGGAGGRQIGGAATFKGADTRPRGIHVAAFDGRGGGSRMDWTPEDGRTEENFGTRDPNYQGRWVVIESGPDGRRYVNDRTGEEAFVKNGETAPWNREKTPVEAARVRAQAALDLEKMKQAGKIDLAKLTGDQRKELQDAQLTLKKYGIDLGIQSEQAKDETERKRIAADLMKKLPEVIAGMGLKDEQADEFRTKLMKAFEGGGQTAAKTPQDGGGEAEPAPTTSDIRTDNHGVKWMIVRDENGKPIGKKRVQ